MSLQGPRISPFLLEELAKAREWHTENGTRHWKIVVNGHFAGILPRGRVPAATGCKADVNTRAQIRRVIRETQGADQ